MIQTRLFFDHNAGAPVLAAALEAAVAAARAGGNPSSVHAEGRAARRCVEDARLEVARLGGVAPERVVFTSGATEANAAALTPDMTEAGRPIRLDRLLVGATEHPSVLAAGRFAAADVAELPVDGDGLIRLDLLAERLEAERAAGRRVLVSVQLANSETGVIQPIAAIARLVHAAGGLLHCDAVQAAGRLPLDDPCLAVDLMSLSAHKIGGLPGAGALLLRHPDLVPQPLIGGGGQESNRRAGTQNTPAIAAFGVAAAAARATWKGSAAVAALRDDLERRLRSNASNVRVLGEAAPRLANTSMLVVPGMVAETAVIAFDLEGVAVSAGSACSSGKVGASRVITAMGLGETLARSGLRLSIGASTTPAEIDRFVEIWARVIPRLVPGRSGDRSTGAME